MPTPDQAPDRVMRRDEAEALIRRVLEANRVSARNAASVARALVAAEIDGQRGHGFSRVAAYAAQARSGKVSGAACPVAEPGGTARVDIDARDGFAFPAIDLAIDELAARAPETGVAVAAIRRSHHCGQLGAHVERLAERGLAALMVANSPKAMAPWGGSAALFGTNPIAFAAPRAGKPPLVIDLSLSRVARGKVMAAAKAGTPIPEGWALDAGGRPTTDPAAALEGTMVPAGDAKGAALALVVEILAATLTGARHSDEAASFFDAEGPPPGVGQLILAFDTSRVPGAGFGPRLETLLGAILAQEGTRLPGESRLQARRALEEGAGLRVPGHLLEEIEALAGA
jgi:(2R)-3-sulfolactate dehydrogenase (NADP+)